MVSPSINPNSPSSRRFFKRNYVDTLEIITPEVYITDDITASGHEVNIVDSIINSHMKAANNLNSEFSGLYISSIPNSNYSSIDNISGLSQYFVQQNNLTKITPQSFERDILFPLGKTLLDFSTSSDFYNYLSGTLLSSLVNYYPPHSADRTASAYANTASGTHIHLINSLSWFYFLNLSGDVRGFSTQPSAIVASALTNVYKGKTLYLNDAIKAFTDFVFLNYETCAAWQDYDLIPNNFLPSSLLDSSLSGPSTSGIQQLDKLKTIIDVIYSPTHSNKQDSRVKDSFENYISNGTLLNSIESEGPFHRLLKAFSYSMFDRLEEVETLNLLYDIDECPREYLPELARLIGWKLYGTDEARQRLQLKNAVSLYKKTGTKESIQAAVNSVFSEDVFDVSASIHELWESYIPYLIYYALTTESSLFENFTTWTREDAISKGVSVYGKPTYSSSSMDFNIRAVVDNILLYLVCLHPNLFRLGGEEFPILVLSGTVVTPPVQQGLTLPLSAGPVLPGVSVFLKDPTFQFKYRERIFPIPPWEQITYYTQCEVTDSFVNDLYDFLICFGVNESFAVLVREYIKDNTLRAYDSFRDDNGWLMFTSGVNDPPNLDDKLKDPTNNNVNLFSLWSGKSSHFKFIMNADSFDFLKNSFTFDSRWAPSYAARITKDFSPAHSIPESRLEASGTDSVFFSGMPKWIINPSKDESYEGSGFTVVESPVGELGKRSPYLLAGPGVSATHINGFRRNGYLSNPTGRDLRRSTVNRVELINSGTVDFGGITENANGIGGVVEISRSNVRRRNYDNTLPMKGYYDRTGFNMPVSWDSSTVEYSYVLSHPELSGSPVSGLGFMPLGYVPSAGNFLSISDYSSIPGVYRSCETSSSPNSFSGVDTSNTFPCRGAIALGADAKHEQFREFGLNGNISGANYVDRGQLSPVVGTMHSVEERHKLKKAEYYVRANFDSFSQDYDKNNSELSFANSSTESNNWFPVSVNDYYNFKFGRGMHQVYDVYADKFLRHGMGILNPELEGGPLIHAHLYGDGLFNGEFRVTGPHNTLNAGTETEQLLVASAIAESPILNLSHSSFSGIDESTGWTGWDYGSHIVSAGSLIASAVMPGDFSSCEIRNRNILSGIDFIHPSGSDVNNSFQIFNIAYSAARNSSAKNYHISNPLVKLKSVRGLSRLRLSVKEASGLTGYSPYYSKDNNLLLPDHNYKLKIRYLAGTEDGQYLGVAPLGVWIHTELENGTFWTYTQDHVWKKNDLGDISETFILDNSHYHLQDFIKTPLIFGRCGPEGILPPDTSSNPSVISDFIKKDYATMEVDFHTFTKGLQRREIREEPYGSQFEERPEGISEDMKRRIETLGSLHTEDQNYVIEIFMVPNSQNITKFVLLDHIGLVDETLYDKITTNVSGDPNPVPFSSYLNPTTDTYTPEDVRVIFNYFNSTLGVNHYLPYASRVVSDMEGYYGVSGGGRLSYRQQPEYYESTKQSNYNNFEYIRIDN